MTTATDLIRQWEADDFKLELYSTGNFTGCNREYIAYKLYHRDKLIFDDNDFLPSILYDAASDRSVASLLGYLSLKPGDTDEEYFENYTTEQLKFCRQHGEYLSLYAMELETEE